MYGDFDIRLEAAEDGRGVQVRLVDVTMPGGDYTVGLGQGQDIVEALRGLADDLSSQDWLECLEAAAETIKEEPKLIHLVEHPNNQPDGTFE